MDQNITNSAIDWELSLKLVNGRKELAADMLKMLIECIPEHQQELKSAFEEQDIIRLHQAAHKLHGALCYCGTPRLKEVTKALETAANGHEITDEITALYHQVEDEMTAVMKAFEQMNWDEL